MADLGSLAAVYAKAATVFKARTPPDKITPAEHLSVWKDLTDTLTGLGASKETWSGNVASGINTIPHTRGTENFIYMVTIWNATKGAWEQIALLENKRTSTNLYLYSSSAKTNVRVILI